MESKAKTEQPRKIMLSGRFYLVDYQRKQFRQTLDPSNYISFDSLEGRQLCSEFGVTPVLNRQSERFAEV